MSVATGDASKMRRSLSFSAIDVFGRLLIQIATTLVLARLLQPEHFGVAGLVLSLAGIFAVLVSAPFEEPLAQRKVVRRGHIATALGVTLLGAVVLAALAVPLGMLLAHRFEVPAFVSLVAASAVIPLSRAPYGVALAWARRRRRFDVIAVANLGGVLFGAAAAVVLALKGAGPWAILALRLIADAVSALILLASFGLWIRPRWSRRHFDDLRWYATYSLSSRLIDNASYFIFNAMVAGLYGLTALGFLNMALRLVEPLRGGIASMSHNLTFSVFVVHRTDREGLAVHVVRIISNLAFLIVPTFLGLAAVAPTLVPVLAGPGWEPAVWITIWLAAGCALSLPVGLLGTALNAMGQPQHDTISRLWGAGVMMIVLPLAQPVQATAVGIARFGGDIARTFYLAESATKALGRDRTTLLGAVVTAWAMAAAMACTVVVAGELLTGSLGDPLRLVVQVLLGVSIYGLGLLLLAPRRVQRAWSYLCPS